jgi:Zn-dependent protease
VPLLRFRGILIEAHWTAVIPVVLYSGLLGTTRYLGRYPDLSGATITAMAVISVLMVPVSVLLHELGHTFQARREGLRASRITLWGLGGVSWNSGPSSPGAEFRLTAAGPLVSAFLAAFFGALGWLARRVGLPTGVVGVVVLIAQFNALMLAFNLIPMVPLDGGRLLHSALWRVRGPKSAFIWASRVGVVIASTVIAFGAIAPFLNVLPQVTGFDPGLTIMIDGVVMLYMTLAYRSAAQVRPQRTGEMRVGDLVEPLAPCEAPAPDVSIARFLEGATASSGYGMAAAAVLENGRTVGAISRGLARLVPEHRRAETAVADVMLRKEDAVVLQRETPVVVAYRTLQGAGSRRGVILERGRVTAIILTSDLADVILRAQDAARGVVETRASVPVRRR